MPRSGFNYKAMLLPHLLAAAWCMLLTLQHTAAANGYSSL